MTTNTTRTEALLRDAAAAAAWPVTPDLRAGVLARIAARPVPSSRSRFRPAARALVLALLALVVLAGVAGALGYRLPGLDLLFVERLPPAGTGLDLGSPVPLGEASAIDRPRVLVPGDLREPDAAWVLGTGDQRIVTLAWRAAAGQPALAGSDLALTVMAVPGDTEAGLIQKLLGQGTTIEAVTVNGDHGWWIAGAPHEILVKRPDGTVGVLRAALAGDTLVFARDGTLYRLESTLGRDATLAVAGSLR